MFDRLVHCDWSADLPKRWLASASRSEGSWKIEDVRRVGESGTFLDDLFTDGRSTLAGFDFPVGLPELYGVQTGLAGFKDAVLSFGEGEWATVFDVADIEDEISIARPFFPRRSLKGHSRASLVRRLCVDSFEDLLRRCERKTETRNAACSVFWTLGGNQVGKGAIKGWHEVVKPSVVRGAGLWPFDGGLRALANLHKVVIAETYPAAAYEASNVVFSRNESKRRQLHRKRKAKAILDHTDRNGIEVGRSIEMMIEDGFGAVKTGEDAFDAFAGLLLMIEVAEGRRAEAPTRKEEPNAWEGWILGV